MSRDAARVAIAALRHLLHDPGALQRMIPIGREAFEGGDFLAAHGPGGRLAPAYSLAVQMHRARATQAHPAPELRAGQAQLAKNSE